MKSFPDYKHFLQENYAEYKHNFLPLPKLVSNKLIEMSYVLEKKMIVFHAVFL